MTFTTPGDTSIVGNTRLVQTARRRFRRAGRLALVGTVAVLGWAAISAPLRARVTHPTRVIAVGANWAHGYVVVPQRGGADEAERRREAALAQLLARQNGFAIVA